MAFGSGTRGVLENGVREVLLGDTGRVLVSDCFGAASDELGAVDLAVLFAASMLSGDVFTSLIILIIAYLPQNVKLVVRRNQGNISMW